MATGAAMPEASKLAATLPRLSVGCHVVLVDGSPLLPAAEVPSLAFARGGSAFAPTLGGFVQRALTGRVSATEIAAEAAAQVTTTSNWRQCPHGYGLHARRSSRCSRLPRLDACSARAGSS